MTVLPVSGPSTSGNKHIRVVRASSSPTSYQQRTTLTLAQAQQMGLIKSPVKQPQQVVIKGSMSGSSPVVRIPTPGSLQQVQVGNKVQYVKVVAPQQQQVSAIYTPRTLFVFSAPAIFMNFVCLYFFFHLALKRKGRLPGDTNPSSHGSTQFWWTDSWLLVSWDSTIGPTGCKDCIASSIGNCSASCPQGSESTHERGASYFH